MVFTEILLSEVDAGGKKRDLQIGWSRSVLCDDVVACSACDGVRDVHRPCVPSLGKLLVEGEVLSDAAQYC